MTINDAVERVVILESRLGRRSLPQGITAEDIEAIKVLRRQSQVLELVKESLTHNDLCLNDNMAAAIMRIIVVGEAFWRSHNKPIGGCNSHGRPSVSKVSVTRKSPL